MSRAQATSYSGALDPGSDFEDIAVGDEVRSGLESAQVFSCLEPLPRQATAGWAILQLQTKLSLGSSCPSERDTDERESRTSDSFRRWLQLARSGWIRLDYDRSHWLGPWQPVATHQDGHSCCRAVFPPQSSASGDGWILSCRRAHAADEDGQDDAARNGRSDPDFSPTPQRMHRARP